MFSIERLRQIIDASEFDSLKGEIENDWFECKGQPYQLKDEPDRRELAKDVSSFANHNGGYILIGVKTKKNITHFGDEVEEIRPFEQWLVDTNQYHNVIRSWIYPEIEEVTVGWISIKGNADKGVVIIYVPPQKPTLKPFLIKKILDEKKHVEIIFGYAERKRDNSQPLSIVDLQRSLRAGMNFDNSLNERFDNLEELIRQTTNYALTKSSNEDFASTISDRIALTLSSGKIIETRAFALTAYPNPRSELTTLFNNSDGSILKHLENPPTLRYGGWNLATQERAKIIRGEFVRAGDTDYKVIDLYRDGTMIFSVVADGFFLAWGRSENSAKINPLALVEAVYHFFSLYKLVLVDLKKEPETITIRIDFRNLHKDGNKSFLVPYGVNSFAYTAPSRFETYEAPEDNMIKMVEVSFNNYSEEVVAFMVLKEIYLWFGLSEDKIPYSRIEGELVAIDPDQIKAL